MTLHRWGRSQGGWAIKAAGGGVVVPSLPTVDTTSLVARWQADHSTVTKSGSEVLTATNIVSPGTRDLAAYAATHGCIEFTNNNPTSPMYGRKGWIFNSQQVMAWVDGSLTARTMSVFLVCQALRTSVTQQIFSIGSVGAGNTNSAILSAYVNSNSAPWLRNTTVSASSVATSSGNAAKHIFGCQPQVIGVVGSATAARLYMNSDALVVGATATSTAKTGGMLGNYANTDPALIWGTAATLGTLAEMIVYDVCVYNVSLAGATADAIAASLQTGYGIPDITDSLSIEGDSIFAGFPGDTDNAYKIFPMNCITSQQWLDIPAGYRVLNTAVSGNKTSDLYDQQIAANSAHSANAMIGGPLSGHNRLVVQIGVNDATSGNSFTGSIAGTVLTVTALATNSSIGVGDKVVGGTSANTVITSLGTGTGGTGTYNINNSQTVAPRNMTGGRAADNIYNVSGGNNSFVNLIASATNGYKNNYDKIYWCVNIAFPGGSGVQASTIDPLRALIRSAPNTINTQFHTDTGTTAANLDIIDLTQITMPTATPADSKVFDTAAAVLLNSTDVEPATAIYQDDTLHPTGTSNIPVTGNEYMVKGGVPLGGTGVGLNSAFL